MGYIFDAMNRSGDKPEPRADESLHRTGRPAPQGSSADAPASEPIIDPAMARAMQDVSAASPATADTDASAASPLRIQPVDLRRIDERLVMLRDPSSLIAEEYRSIRTGLLARWEHRRRLIHTITSAVPQEGKTLTSLNLGTSLAELPGRSTIVIEADLRLPQFGKLLRLPASPGLVGVLEGKAELGQAIHLLSETGLAVMPAGRSVGTNAVQLLSSRTMVQVFEELKRRFDHVIVDTPPVLELSDAGILGAMSDDVLLVSRLEHTPRPIIEQAVRTLSSYHAPVAGVIATDQKKSRSQYYHYHRYGYHYGSARRAA